MGGHNVSFYVHKKFEEHKISTFNKYIIDKTSQFMLHYIAHEFNSNYNNLILIITSSFCNRNFFIFVKIQIFLSRIFI